MAVNKSKLGTFCIVLEKQLVVSNCPLPQGTCFWKHRHTGQCKYTEKEMSPADLAMLVGLEPLPDNEVLRLREELQVSIKQSLGK